MAQPISEDAIIIGEHFQLGKKIGEGSFGIIHEGTNLATNQRIAVKLESVKTNDPQLHDECRVYRHLHGLPGIPNVHYFGVEDGYNVLCIDLLGPSLEDLFDICGRRFSVKTVAMLARQMIARIKSVQERSIIYRDIKPDNFLIGPPGNDTTVHLIDFGLAKLYRDLRTGKHIPLVTKKNVTGTARYMSVNTHAGCEQSRRDDLESLGFVFMYFLRGKLPWQGMNAETNAERNEMIGAKKRATPIDDLCAGYPQEFADYLHYVRSLKFEDDPRYDYLSSLFANVLERLGEREDLVFDWHHPSVTARWKERSSARGGRLHEVHANAPASKKALHSAAGALPPSGAGRSRADNKRAFHQRSNYHTSAGPAGVVGGPASRGPGGGGRARRKDRVPRQTVPESEQINVSAAAAAAVAAAAGNGYGYDRAVLPPPARVSSQADVAPKKGETAR